MALSIVGAGYGRTGTTSLRLALEKLGFNSCFKVGSSCVGMFLWNRFKEKKSIDWKTVLFGFQSTLDLPMCLFYRELSEVFPSAKVILTVRDSQQWYESIKTVFLDNVLNPELVYSYPEQKEYLIDLFSHAFGHNLADRSCIIAAYERHNAEVQDSISRDRLLVYDVGHGWEPLCGFLGVPVPKDPFPHVNSKINLVRID